MQPPGEDSLSGVAGHRQRAWLAAWRGPELWHGADAQWPGESTSSSINQGTPSLRSSRTGIGRPPSPSPSVRRSGSAPPTVSWRCARK